MATKNRSAIACGVMAVLSGPVFCAGAVIGVDSRSGGSDDHVLATSTRYATFRQTLMSPSAGVMNTVVGIGTFDATHLAGLDALVLKQADFTLNQLSQAEIDAVHAFVASGHGLMVSGEGGNQTEATLANLNQLVGAYGVTYAPGAVEPDGYTITGIRPSPITAGVVSIGVDYERPFSAISAPAVDLTVGSGADDTLAYVSGAGPVVLMSDTSMWTNPGFGSDRDITFGNNQQLLRNTVAFIVPEPMTVSLAVVAAFVRMTARRTRRSSRVV